MAVPTGDALLTLHRRSADLRRLHQQWFHRMSVNKSGPANTVAPVGSLHPASNSHLMAVEEYLAERLYGNAIEYASALLCTKRTIPKVTILNPPQREPDEFELETLHAAIGQSETERLDKKQSGAKYHLTADQLAFNTISSILLPFASLCGDRVLLDMFDCPLTATTIPTPKKPLMRTLTDSSASRAVLNPTEVGFWPFLMSLIRLADQPQFHELCHCLINCLERDLVRNLERPAESFLWGRMVSADEDWQSHVSFLIAQLDISSASEHAQIFLMRLLSMYSIICGSVGIAMEIEEYCRVIKQRLLDPLHFSQLQRLFRFCDDDLFCCHLLDVYLTKDLSAFINRSEDSLLFLSHLFSEPSDDISLSVVKRFLWSATQLFMRLLNFFGQQSERQLVGSISDCVGPFLDSWIATVNRLSDDADGSDNDDGFDDGDTPDSQECLQYLQVLKATILPD